MLKIPTGTTRRSARREKEIPKVVLKLHLRSLVTLILECQRLHGEYSLKNKKNDEIMPFIRDITFDFELNAPLLFDPSLFKADRQCRVPEDIQLILVKNTNDRTEEELGIVGIFLKGINTVREYPIRMQRNIAKYGYYERYDCKRILIRQGHRAASFYIILSGTVAVIVMNDARTLGRLSAYLHKGQSFGELAIIHKSTRQSTVVAKETVELLTISIKDFHEIFMSGGSKMIMDPDYDDFIKASFLQGFPKDILERNNEKFLFQYFRNNEILSRDSNNSQWIYLIKSGEIAVIYLERSIKKENTEDIKSNAQHVRTIAEDYDIAYKNEEKDQHLFKDCKWIQVQKLCKNNVFGLEQCFYERQPRFILVSRGVEVFMLDKALFLSQCPQKVLADIKLRLINYPDEKEIQRIIDDLRQWLKFRHKTLRTTLKSIKQSK